jgi:hypothetical protein
MYDQGGGGLLAFLPRAMEWHVFLLACLVVGVFVPWMLLLATAGLAYTAWYCIASAGQAKLADVLAPRRPMSTRDRLRWRATIAWFHLLEPLARDWGRLKGGLTPWRSALRGGSARPRLSRWGQRWQPLQRRVEWSYSGDVRLEQYGFLERLTKRLVARGCAAGWNPDHHDWDLKVRRGALGEARVRIVVEHHGGPRRLARLSATIAPTRAVYWGLGAATLTAAVVGAFGVSICLGILLAVLGVLWVAPIIEADRLEAIVHSEADVVAEELVKVASTTQMVTVAHEAHEADGSRTAPSAPSRSQVGGCDGR